MYLPINPLLVRPRAQIFVFIVLIIALIGIFGMIIAIIIRPISGYRIDKIEAKAAIILNVTLISMLSFFFICLLSNFQFY